MKNIKGSNMADLRKSNQARVVELLLKGEDISRAEISKILGLTPPSITAIINVLLEKGLLKETGIQTEKTSVGRKRKNIQLVADAKLILGVEIGINSLLFGVINLKGEILEKYSFNLKNKDIEYIINLVFQGLKSLVEKYKEEKLLGIGIAVTGLVDCKQGVLVNSPNLAWQNINLKADIENKLKLPVFIDNNVRLMALGENKFGYNWLDISKMVLVHVGYGIGAGIILNGDLYYGKNYAAGELGHITIEANGSLCTCGKKGCLETLASGKAITSLYAEKCAYKEWDYKQMIEEVLSKENNNNIVTNIMQNAGSYLGIAVSHLINLFAPELIIIHGSIFSSTRYFEAMKEEIKLNSFGVNTDIPIKESKLKEELVLQGIAAFLIQKKLLGKV